ncbi:MAG: hypothetical protein U0736_09245 [Gemmataceae bacterium]
MPHATQMSAADTGLLVVDMVVPLPLPDANALTATRRLLIDVARLLDMTVQATEQYPDRGRRYPTWPPGRRCGRRRRRSFAAASWRWPRRFTARRAAEGPRRHRDARLRTQHRLDLLALDFRVYLAVDVGARHRLDHDTALRRMEQAGRGADHRGGLRA